MANHNLQASVALIDGHRQGTGFFIACDGTLLTCFHVIGDPDTGHVLCDNPKVIFGEQAYAAQVLRCSPNPRVLDAAILQLETQALPPEAALMSLAVWKTGSSPGRFKSFGFRPADQTAGLHALGEISGLIPLQNGQQVLQLSSQPGDAQQMRPGMSGAPIALQDTGQIIGMAVSVIRESEESIPCAIPIDQIARFWPALEERLLEDDLLEQLQRLFLSPLWFTDANFRHFCSQSHISAAHTGIEGAREALVQDLGDQLRGRGQVYDVINFLREYRRDIPLAHELTLPPTQRINFVNRQDELADSCGRSAIPYLLYDAPFGYGKTELLKAIERQHFLDNWICLRAGVLPGEGTARHLIASLAEQAGVSGINQSLEASAYGFMLAGALARQVSTSDARGVVLLVDQIENFDPDQIPVFLNAFLDALVKGLRGVEFRLRLAGRHVDPAWKDPRNKFDVTISSLTPFRFRYVRETLHHLFPEQSQLYLRAAHIMHLTGGHPGCMARLIRCLNFDMPPDQIIADEATFRDTVLTAADEVRATIPERLREIFDMLSLFRRYTSRLLEYLLRNGIVQYDKGADRLEEELTATYLVSRQYGFIQDDIVRRLLSIRLWLQDSENFLSLCAYARDAYVANLEYGSRRPDVLVAEALYQEARLGYFDDREALRKQFFAPGGTVERYLAYIANDADPLDAKRNLEALLTGQREGDWELRFALNYFLRDTDYTDDPLKSLLQRVRAL